MAYADNLASPITVQAKGGRITIAFERGESGSFTQVFMTGPAVMVLEGTVFV